MKYTFYVIFCVWFNGVGLQTIGENERSLQAFRYTLYYELCISNITNTPSGKTYPLIHVNIILSDFVLLVFLPLLGGNSLNESFPSHKNKFCYSHCFF